MEINIVYATDNNYVKIMGISILSILKFVDPNDVIHFYIMEENIDLENKEKIYSMCSKYNCSIEFFNIHDILVYFLDNKIGMWMGGCTALARIFMARLLPDSIHKVLYLDCDTLINDSLNNLFNTNLLGKTVGMCYDCIRNEFKKYIGIKPDYPYFNSGVLLIDLERWREFNYENKISEYIQTEKKSKLPDQDALNIVLDNDILPLDARYNFQSHFFLYPYRKILMVYNLKKIYWYNKEIFNESKKNICIFHFCGNTFIRPWYKNSKHPAKLLYDSYYYNSPWAMNKQITYKMLLYHKIQYILFKYFPQSISAFLGSCMQRVFVFLYFKV
jgi:lipopolysaccharide biosynthesis glycosyltransferase